MAFAVCSYPKLNARDYKLIQDFRKENDELYYQVAEPHFGFVFPISQIQREHFIREVHEKSNGIKKIEFEIRCATINKDAFIDYFHLLLVPDKGYSDIIKVHDKFYSDVFFEFLRLDIDFIPHMGIANSKDKYKVKNMVDKWNKNDFSIKGIIDSLTIIDYTENVLTNLEEIKLK
jgi:hypothetical protein